jgi:hypothetical protein
VRILQVLPLAGIVAFALAATGTADRPMSETTPYAMVVRILDENSGKYEVEIENMNPVRFVSSFTWTPPSGLQITEITGAIGGKCLLMDDGTITCKGMAAPPKTEQGIGGRLIVDFTASGHQPKWTGSFWIHYGLVGSVKVQMSTFSDLPLCKTGQHTTKAHPCATV